MVVSLFEFKVYRSRIFFTSRFSRQGGGVGVEKKLNFTKFYFNSSIRYFFKKSKLIVRIFVDKDIENQKSKVETS